MNLKTNRTALRISQSRLARKANVSRFKISMYELGDGNLTPDELLRIQEALQAEANRLRNLPVGLELTSPYPTATEVGV
jgi:transcriptional regulator with XRE-family HTH domain